MPDLNERLRGIDRLSPPDLWSVARAKAELGAPVATHPSGWRRAALIAASLVVGLGAVAWVMVAIRTTPPTRVPSAQPILSPAPRGDCGFGLVRSSPVGTAKFVRLMEGYLPTWMPQGFGLLASFSPEQSADGFGGYGIWSDNTCREVELTFNSTGRPQGPVNPGNRPSVGPWIVTADVPGGCSNGVLGKARCLDYSAATPDGLLSLLMMGVDRNEGDRIALSIFDGSSSASTAPAALASESFAVGSQPSSLAASDGWIWVAEEQTNSIDKVDPSSGRAVDSISLSGRAEWLVGGDGFLYAATYSQAHGSDIQVIDTATDRAVRTFPGLRGPLVLGADGLWAVSSNLVAETNDVVLVDPATGRILDRVPVPGSPIDMAAAGPGSVWVQPLVSGAGNNVAVRVSTTETGTVTPIEGPSTGIWLASNEDGVWLSASMPGMHSSSAFVAATGAATGSRPQPFGSVYNFRPMTVADGRVWFVAGPGDGPVQGVCGLMIDTQEVDECADVSVADLEAAHQPVVFEPTTNTLWVSAYELPEISRVSLSQG